MAELAAKIRARFRRRHSALPGPPSLLSRRSARSSTGSHGSSLFRPFSHGHISRSSICETDQKHADDGEAASRVGSSRVSVYGESKYIITTSSTHAHPEHGHQPERGEQPAAADGLVVAPHEAGDGGRTGEAQEAAHEDEQAQARRHNDEPTETKRTNSCHASPASTASQAAVAPSNDADVSCQGMDSSSTNLLTSTAVPAAPAVAAPVAAPASASLPGPTPLTDPTASTAGTIPAQADPDSLQQMNAMSGKDRPPSSRKLSHVSEHPPPDNDNAGNEPLAIDYVAAVDNQLQPRPQSQLQLQPSPGVVTLAKAADIVADPGPVTVALPAAAVVGAATSVSGPKRNDANLRPLRTAPRTPSLAPPLQLRPFHIHLPPASFGGPSPKLSPGAGYSHTSTAAPTSPLRHSTLPPPARPAPARQQSLLANRQSTLIHTLLRGCQPEDPNDSTTEQLLPISGNMVTRKIWVKRPGASATLVIINEDDLVDDVREMILRKYSNSLGRQYDAPDLTLRIRPHGNQQERMLGPEEPMSRTLDAYFPSGQTIDDALIIELPLRRTPRASPRVGPPHAPHIQYYVEDPQPPETAGDYFGPGALSALPVTVTAPSAGSGHTHTISVLSSGQVPQIASPGGRRARDYRERPERPRLGRQHTSSPTVVSHASGAAHQSAIASAAIVPHDPSQAVPLPPAIPTPPPVESASAVPQRVATPPPRVASPRPKKSKKKSDHPMLPKGMLNGTVPPINVLIVEDNIINLKLLEAFVKRLKVRWSTAMNGRDAVLKWRGGSFHLVLMDIQLPIMSGLDATREIRRLERVNSIGVFSSAASSAPEEVKGEPDEKDKLENKDLFKSPVIIVALTASSLQSDRHEALAAGCNDFLTKPVNFVWLERKVMEWGCMQALIDFDGWRKWKDFSLQQVDDRATKAAELKAKSKNRPSLTQAVAAGA